jgi:hypothetical protein
MKEMVINQLHRNFWPTYTKTNGIKLDIINRMGRILKPLSVVAVRPRCGSGHFLPCVVYPEINANDHAPGDRLF